MRMVMSAGDPEGSLAGQFFRWFVSNSIIACALIAVAVRANAPEPVQPRTLTLLEEIQETGELMVITRNGPTTLYLERDETAGFEFELARAFAAHLGVNVGFSIRDSVPGLFHALQDGRGHLIAASLPRTLSLPSDLAAGPAYSEVRQQLVCHRDGPVPAYGAVEHSDTTDAELGGINGGTIIRAVADSGYEGRLPMLQAQVPALHWAAAYGPSTEDLMVQVAGRSIDCTVGDSTLVSVHRRYHPDLVVPFDVSGPEALGWIVPAEATQLQDRLQGWFAQPETQALIDRLHEKYYGHVTKFDYVDLARFKRRIERRLPRYRAAFEQAEAETGLPWTLLAAVAYQESHWRPDARSFTGVRGLMMLTRLTAREMGVSNRLDPEQSIQGGSHYLARLLKRLPESVTGEDRLWFALAAYNVGYGHLMDARILASREGLDPDRWSDVKLMLPLLRQKKYYRTVPHGYARGKEPVHYVQAVRHYRDLLERDQRLFGAPETRTEARARMLRHFTSAGGSVSNRISDARPVNGGQDA